MIEDSWHNELRKFRGGELPASFLPADTNGRPLRDPSICIQILTHARAPLLNEEKYNQNALHVTSPAIIPRSPTSISFYITWTSTFRRWSRATPADVEMIIVGRRRKSGLRESGAGAHFGGRPSRSVPFIKTMVERDSGQHKYHIICIRGRADKCYYVLRAELWTDVGVPEAEVAREKGELTGTCDASDGNDWGF